MSPETKKALGAVSTKLQQATKHLAHRARQIKALKRHAGITEKAYTHLYVTLNALKNTTSASVRKLEAATSGLSVNVTKVQEAIQATNHTVENVQPMLEKHLKKILDGDVRPKLAKLELLHDAVTFFAQSTTAYFVASEQTGTCTIPDLSPREKRLLATVDTLLEISKLPQDTRSYARCRIMEALRIAIHGDPTAYQLKLLVRTGFLFAVKTLGLGVADVAFLNLIAEWTKTEL